MGTRKSPGKGHHTTVQNEIESIPSEIGEDMWGEIPKYQYMLHKRE